MAFIVYHGLTPNPVNGQLPSNKKLVWFIYSTIQLGSQLTIHRCLFEFWLIRILSHARMRIRWTAQATAFTIISPARNESQGLSISKPCPNALKRFPTAEQVKESSSGGPSRCPKSLPFILRWFRFKASTRVTPTDFTRINRNWQSRGFQIEVSILNEKDEKLAIVQG